MNIVPPQPQIDIEASGGSIKENTSLGTNSQVRGNHEIVVDDVLPSLGWLDRLLPVWIFLAMALGMILGNFVGGIESVLDRGKLVGVSVPLAIGLLIMIYPVLCRMQIESLWIMFQARAVWKQILLSLVINWIIAPFYMLALAWAFLPDKPGLREGVIMVGVARCIAMVLIWITLSRGDTQYGGLIVAVNSILQIVLFAPLSVFFIRVISGDSTGIQLDYPLVAKSVAVFLGIPFLAAILTRLTLRRLVGALWYDNKFCPFIAPLSLIGLLYTIILLFALQGHRVVHQIVSVLRVAAPMLVYFVTVFFATIWVCRRFMSVGYELSICHSFTAASNNFELAIAIAVATFGANSDQALAATVGPLVEVPVLLGLVYVARWMGRRWKWPDQTPPLAPIGPVSRGEITEKPNAELER